MKATETKFLPFLQGTKQFIIPIYQRTYSWTIGQCQQLWDDIRRVAVDEQSTGHFVGSIVYIDRGLYEIKTVPQLLVIDGQQRLTTLSLLLTALGKVIEERGVRLEISRKKINNYYLLNSDEDDDLRYKLLLTQSDKEALIDLLEDRENTNKAVNRLSENYAFFLSQLRKSEVDLAEIYDGIGKLIVVDIALDRHHDNPQLIFESLNSTGLKLTQADLIRNYILMGLENNEQNELYQNYWFPMEQSFGYVEYTSHFDRFMRDYLTIKTGRIPNISNVYSEFKIYAQTKQIPIRDLITDIYQFSKYFVRLAFARDPDAGLNECFENINTLRVDVAYPFIIEVYQDYDRHLITREDFLKILRLIESYIFRRAICGIPTNSLNKTFATLNREVRKNQYVESIQAAFVLKDSYRRFPTDQEFQRELSIKDVNNFRNRNYLLRKLENAERSEAINIDSYNIEPIFPLIDDLPSWWREELGANWQDIQSTYGQTVANLTLVGYQSSATTLRQSFQKKRDHPEGFANTKLNLNQDLAQCEQWNEGAIQARLDRLSALAVKVWAAPKVDNDDLQQYREREPSTTFTLDIHAEFLQGPVLELFEQLRRRILNLDASVREEVKQRYIAYKADSNFVDIVPQSSRLKLFLNLPFVEINDPKNLCRDVTHLGQLGNGDVQVFVAQLADIDDVMPLIEQSLAWQQDKETN